MPFSLSLSILFGDGVVGKRRRRRRNDVLTSTSTLQHMTCKSCKWVRTRRGGFQSSAFPLDFSARLVSRLRSFVDLTFSLSSSSSPSSSTSLPSSSPPPRLPQPAPPFTPRQFAFSRFPHSSPRSPSSLHQTLKSNRSSAGSAWALGPSTARHGTTARATRRRVATPSTRMRRARVGPVWRGTFT